jgi:hypothetical protein
MSRTVGYSLHPLVGTSTIWGDDATALARASSSEVSEHHYAAKLANQLYYATSGQAGNFFGYSGVGYAGYAAGFNTAVVWGKQAGSAPVYIMKPNATRYPVYLVKEEGAEETLNNGVEHKKLKEALLAGVPLPNPAEVLHGRLTPEGADAVVMVWCPATDEWWEMRRLALFAAGEHKGEWHAGESGYQASMAQSVGIYPTGAGEYMGTSASGLVRGPGSITIADLIRVLRGGKIGHALGMAAIVCEGRLEPAIRNDTHILPKTENGRNLELEENGEYPNGAYPNTDAIPEGLRVAFPAASTAAEHGISASTEPLATAIYEAIREHGMIIRDSGTNCVLTLEDPRSLPIRHPHVNPFAKAEGGNATQIKEYVNEPLVATVGSEWHDATLPALKETLSGSGNVLTKLPWRELEQLAPASS